MYKEKQDFGTKLERSLASLLAIISGIILIVLSLRGPLGSGEISYHTHPLIVNQLIGQDIINLFPVSFILIIGGILLYYKKNLGKYLLISTPLFMIYYALSYTMGWEWMEKSYSGNSEQYFFCYLFVLISALVIMLYCLSVFPKKRKGNFKRPALAVYSVGMGLFLAVFAGMWIKQILEVQATGTTKGYDIAPMAFCLVRTIDLGFCVPLGYISIYLLWTRVSEAFAIQFLFYGFFVTQILAVVAMGTSMYLNQDPTIKLGELAFFIFLALLLILGFIFVIRGYFKKN
jgi:hypothetical protein